MCFAPCEAFPTHPGSFFSRTLVVANVLASKPRCPVHGVHWDRASTVRCFLLNTDRTSARNVEGIEELFVHGRNVIRVSFVRLFIWFVLITTAVVVAVAKTCLISFLDGCDDDVVCIKLCRESGFISAVRERHSHTSGMAHVYTSTWKFSVKHLCLNRPCRIHPSPMLSFIPSI